MDWQIIVVTALIVAAAAYLGYGVWHRWRTPEKAGDCGQCEAKTAPLPPASPAKRIVMVELQGRKK